MKALEADHALEWALLVLVVASFAVGVCVGVVGGRARQVVADQFVKSAPLTKPPPELRARAVRAKRDDRALLHAAELR